MAASFSSQTQSLFLAELAEYLSARGLSAQDIPHNAGAAYDLGYFLNGQPYILEGWEFILKDMFGGQDDNARLFRPCNWPEEGELAQRRKEGDEYVMVPVEKPPKFIQRAPKGHEFLNWISPYEEMVQSPIVVFHEKTTSAYLCNKALGAPCLGLSGCWNWSKGSRKPKDTLLKLVTNLKKKAVLMVCLDGDITTNKNVIQAASALKGWVSELRPDVTMVFPTIPMDNPDKVGWDDWTVAQEDPRQAWLELLAEPGIEITSLIPAEWLMMDYGVSLCEFKKQTMVEHTAENYRRLLNHPRWENYKVDSMGGMVFNIEDTNDRRTKSSFALLFHMWLESNVYRGMGTTVKASYVERVVNDWAEAPENRASLPITILENQPEVEESEAHAAALSLITEGIKVTGPMTQEHTVETLLRVFRDMVSLWSDDTTIDPQWAVALVGPSGCGKSNFPKSLLGCFNDWGYEPAVSQFMKDGPRAAYEEVMRVARDNMIGVYDEYDPDDRSAKAVEQNLFSMTTTRKFKMRKMREEDGVEQLRHASVFLTTTDKNRQYIRSGKDTGERRFITLEVQGVVPYSGEGKLSSDRQVVKECGAVLLRWGLQAWRAGYPGDATEFSSATTEEYLGHAEVLQRMGRLWARGDLRGVLKRFIDQQARDATESARFSLPQFSDCLLPGERLSRQERADMANFVLECGAQDIGKARVNLPDGSNVMKDKVYEVLRPEYEAFVDNILSKI